MDVAEENVKWGVISEHLLLCSLSSSSQMLSYMAHVMV